MSVHLFMSLIFAIMQGCIVWPEPHANWAEWIGWCP